MRILGIETSCDETAVGIVDNGRELLANVVGSQIEVHARYGGIVPEVASRQHMLAMLPIYREALTAAQIKQDSLDAIAVTVGPGLAGSLIVGVNFAKGIAFALGVPLLGINHLDGHVYGAWLGDAADPAVRPGFPLICLIASGGHTDLLLMKEHSIYRLLGGTRDDAAGEAFDKVARILGLGFPGGPQIERLARSATAPERLPRAWMKGNLEFSFSGLKTATLHRARDLGLENERHRVDQSGGKPDHAMAANVAAGFQESVIDVLVHKTVSAARQYHAAGIILSGGVAANSALRLELETRSPIPVIMPDPSLCTDNGAMVAAAGFFGRNRTNTLFDEDVLPSLRLGAT